MSRDVPHRSALRRVADDAQLVPVGIAKIRTVVVLVVLGPRPRRPFANAAARRAIEPYSLDRMTDDYLALYARLMRSVA